MDLKGPCLVRRRRYCAGCAIALRGHGHDLDAHDGIAPPAFEDVSGNTQRADIDGLGFVDRGRIDKPGNVERGLRRHKGHDDRLDNLDLLTFILRRHKAQFSNGDHRRHVEHRVQATHELQFTRHAGGVDNEANFNLATGSLPSACQLIRIDQLKFVKRARWDHSIHGVGIGRLGRPRLDLPWFAGVRDAQLKAHRDNGEDKRFPHHACPSARHKLNTIGHDGRPV